MTFDERRLSSLIEKTGAEPSSPDQDSRDLRPFAEQLIAIAHALRDEDLAAISSFSNELNGGKSTASSKGDVGSYSHSSDTSSAQPYLNEAREAYALRRMRTGIFNTFEIFGEPAWDILLDLYIAQSEQKAVSVSSACIGSASPPTTGLRWLGVLADYGLITRDQDPQDQRRILVQLTGRGIDCMNTYFASAAQRAVSA